ncbi:MAG: phosphoserine phosphatase SerB [Methanosphaera sp.]|uniref:phosphoserine phosphatase SerB n=1 Tax=Methanosphaera sp. TaxID=2666342 RepID=UPI0025D7E220|nr:phosphoserine phosphatase SerB [Methanosphaera sp.]MCI5867190.1 phosphoserine phosphatase SerB [Methanosphaera sp.]MDD6534742.1 phosphoserine phosphatase SerB [Methanosphaera sp.]MDY3955590.1 phosphoserine phosphatase SerB [Methanosphaera sp.]
MIKLVVFDLDNVLIDTETIDEIAEINGNEEQISEITLQAMQGKIPFETSIRERVKILKGISVDDIDAKMNNISLNPGAKETAAELKKRGYTIAIITGSFDVIALKVKEWIGADYAFYNTLEVEDGKLTGEVSGPLVTQNKVDVLKGLVDELGITLDECVTIGDGANDLEMIKQAKIGIAYNAKPILKEHADIQINEKDLRKVLDIMTDEEKITKEEVVEEVDAQEEVQAEEVEAKDAEAQPEEQEDAMDYSKLNFQQLLQVKRTFEAELTELKNVRDNMNENTKAFRQERDKLNQELKETLNKALEKRNERDEINKEVRKFKELRNECNEELKKSEWGSGKKEISNIQAEINKIDKTIQTKVLDIRKENELVKRVSDLTKQLKKIQTNVDDEESAGDLKEKSEEYHQKVVELSDKAQAVHEDMIESFNKIDGIREKADEKHKEFINSRNAATAKHEEVKAKLTEIRKVNKFMDQAKSSSRSRKGEGKPDETKEKEEAEEIFQKFKDGKKLTTEEFLLLQKYNIM